MKWKMRPAVFNAKILVCILIQKRLIIKLSQLNDALHYMCAFQYHYVLLISAITPSRWEKESTVPGSRGQERGREGKGRNGKAVHISRSGQAVDRKL